MGPTLKLLSLLSCLATAAGCSGAPGAEEADADVTVGDDSGKADATKAYPIHTNYLGHMMDLQPDEVLTFNVSAPTKATYASSIVEGYSFWIDAGASMTVLPSFDDRRDRPNPTAFRLFVRRPTETKFTAIVGQQTVSYISYWTEHTRTTDNPDFLYFGGSTEGLRYAIAFTPLDSNEQYAGSTLTPASFTLGRPKIDDASGLVEQLEYLVVPISTVDQAQPATLRITRNG